MRRVRVNWTSLPVVLTSVSSVVHSRESRGALDLPELVVMEDQAMDETVLGEIESPVEICQGALEVEVAVMVDGFREEETTMMAVTRMTGNVEVTGAVEAGEGEGRVMTKTGVIAAPDSSR